jgi:hypothetical protein
MIAENGTVDGCVALARTKDQQAGLGILTPQPGQTIMTLSVGATIPNGTNESARYKIDSTDFGVRRSDVESNGTFSIVLDQDPMFDKIAGAKQVTIVLRNKIYAFDVTGSDQVFSSLKTCPTERTAAGNGIQSSNSAQTASIKTLTCTFKPAQEPRDSVSCIDLGGMIDCSRHDRGNAEQSVDISLDENTSRILNRNVSLGPQFSESNIRWREPRGDNHFVDYELDRHSGAARIYFGGLKEQSEHLMSVGTCQVSPERRF